MCKILVYDEKEGGGLVTGPLKPEIINKRTLANIQDWETFARENFKELEKAFVDTLENIRKEVNLRLSTFSRIEKIKLQAFPFEKTPTQKIKRFLYPLEPAVSVS